MKKLNYLSDDFNESGSDINELLEITRTIDTHTMVRQFDFKKGEILHYVGINNKRQYFSSFSCSEPLRFPMEFDERVASTHNYLVMEEVTPKEKFTFPSKMNSIDNFQDYETKEIPIDFKDGKNRTVFYIPLSGDNKKHVIYTSSALRKTMVPRLVGNDIGMKEDSLARDLYLASLIQESKKKIDRYLVFRHYNSVKKAFGIFTKDPKRRTFCGVIDAVVNFSENAECVWWNFTNNSGMEAVFHYPDVGFPSALHFRPVILVASCDTGHVADHIMIGWQNTCGPGFSAFYTEKIPIKDETNNVKVYQDAIRNCKSTICKEAERIRNLAEHKLKCNNTEYEQYIKMVSKIAIEGSGAGKKAEKAFIEFASIQPCATTMFQCVELILKAADEQVFLSKNKTMYSGRYAEKQVRRKGIKRLLDFCN